MSRGQKEILRPLLEHERQALEHIARSGSERANELLGVAAEAIYGKDGGAALGRGGKRSGDALY